MIKKFLLLAILLLVFFSFSCKYKNVNRNNNAVIDGNITTTEYNCRNIYVKEIAKYDVTFIVEYYDTDNQYIKFKYIFVYNNQYSIKLSNRNHIILKEDLSNMYPSVFAEIEVIDFLMIQNSYQTGTKYKTTVNNDNFKLQ
jgi:hypothetical protein